MNDVPQWQEAPYNNYIFENITGNSSLYETKNTKIYRRYSIIKRFYCIKINDIR